VERFFSSHSQTLHILLQIQQDIQKILHLIQIISPNFSTTEDSERKALQAINYARNLEGLEALQVPKSYFFLNTKEKLI